MKETVKRFRFVHNYKFITDNTNALAQLTPEFQLSSRHTRYLALDSTYDNVYKGYNRDRRMNLKHAKRAGLSMTESDDIETMLNFFKAHVAHKVVGGVAESSWRRSRILLPDVTRPSFKDENIWIIETILYITKWCAKS